jgi:carboxyl-terminal processing protease
MRTLSVVLLLALQADSAITPAASRVLDEAIDLTRKNALGWKNVAWDVVEPRVRTMAAGAQKPEEVYPAIRYLLEQLGDNHSFLLPPAQTRALRTGALPNPVPQVRALPQGVGYIRIPGYVGGDREAAKRYATQVHASMIESMPLAPCGWVVDLRQNTGGNMWPMLAGLQPLLGSGPLGTFEKPGSSSPPWVAGQSVGVEPPRSLGGLEAAWVAVLTGARTASSGEAMAIAFKGRPRTRSFGLPTNGLSTANASFPLSDGATLVLTVAIDVDRNGRRYGAKVDPDQRVYGGGSGDPESDEPLFIAKQWIRSVSGCAQ